MLLSLATLFLIYGVFAENVNINVLLEGKCSSLPYMTHYDRQQMICYVRSDRGCRQISFPATSLPKVPDSAISKLRTRGLIRTGENSQSAGICAFQTRGDCSGMTQVGPNCFDLSEKVMNWNDAWQACGRTSSGMLTPHDDSDIRDAYSYILSIEQNRGQGVFLGQKISAGQWINTDGNQLDYFRWTPKPNGGAYLDNGLASVLEIDSTQLATYITIARTSETRKALCHRRLSTEYDVPVQYTNTGEVLTTTPPPTTTTTTPRTTTTTTRTTTTTTRTTTTTTTPRTTTTPMETPKQAFDRIWAANGKPFMNRMVFNGGFLHRYTTNPAKLWGGSWEQNLGRVLPDNAFSQIQKWCPKLVHMQVVWLNDGWGPNIVTSMAAVGYIPARYHVVDVFWCAPSDGYCGATLPLTMIASNDDGQRDLFWTTSRSEIAAVAGPNPYYQKWAQGTTCYLW